MEEDELRRLERLARRIGEVFVRTEGQPDPNTITALHQQLETAREELSQKDAEAHSYAAGVLDALAWSLDGARDEIEDQPPSLRETLRAVLEMIAQWG